MNWSLDQQTRWSLVVTTVARQIHPTYYDIITWTRDASLSQTYGRLNSTKLPIKTVVRNLTQYSAALHLTYKSVVLF